MEYESIEWMRALLNEFGEATMTILINIGKQSDGCTYRLHPRSRLAIREKYGDSVKPIPTLFVGYKTKEEFETLHGPMWQQIAVMLTGLSWRLIQEEWGGAQIYDPVAEKEITVIRADEKGHHAE